MALRIGTSTAGSTFYTQGAAIAELVTRSGLVGEVKVIETNLASVDNANRLDRGEIEFGFMASNWIGLAKNGSPPFDHKIALRMASPANAGPIFFIALARSGIKDIPDLKGRRVAVGPKGSGMAKHVETIFDALGISSSDFTPFYLDFPQGADALVAGEIDAQFQPPIPNAVMTNLSERVEVRAIPYAQGQIEKVLSEVSFYRRITMKRGAFRGIEEDIAQVAVVNVVVTHERVGADAVRAVVKTMIENADTLARMNPLFKGLADLYDPLRSKGPAALEMGGVSLHPGALYAYKETGLIS
ncbi:MAG: TAXI family TRAP transporter solute-binding subunit, partial [Deltaproteobacteria bacterium]|nr:TAXI family TRAP transporter solute-binding subunit [Deltaproteobacteria bacterium]